MLKRITEEYAKEQNFIDLDNDPLDSDVSEARFYTLTPHQDPIKRERGMEKVTYYLARKRFESEGKRGKEWIYVLSNPAYDSSLLKIGFTSQNPEDRKTQIDESTGVPVPFKIEYYKRVINGREVERAVHKYLSQSRINPNREFFQITLDKAIEAIEKVADEIQNEYNLQ